MSNSKFSKTIALCLGILAVAFLIGYSVLAWTEPQSSPPACNPGDPGCDAPLNEGPSTQYKSGALGIGGLLEIDLVMRLIPTDSPVTCDSTRKGSLYYDNSLSEICHCNGSSWQQVDGGGGC